MQVKQLARNFRKIKNKIRLLSRLLMLSALSSLFVSVSAFAGENAGDQAGELTILFTSDIHDYLYPTEVLEDGKLMEMGGGARLATIIRENTDESTLYLDCGDYSMGTLYQAAFSDEAYELRNLGQTGCHVTTFGNHEFDYGAIGLANMLRAAKASGDPLPELVVSNIDFSGDLSAEQAELQKAMESYGVKEHTIIECAGYKIGIFGLLGYDCIECIQTDLSYIDYKEKAKEEVAVLKAEGCDLIIALSHSGNEDGGKSGEDIDLAKKVEGIDLIISGHTHSKLEQPVIIGETVIVSDWEYLKQVGKLKLRKNPGSSVEVLEYQNIPVDFSVAEDPDTRKRLEGYQKEIEAGYLRDKGGSFDKVIAHSNFSMMSLTDMYKTHQEFPVGDLIADSYIYEAEKNGIDDIDVALVGLGTIRSSIREGDITVADAFEICSLGVGSDGSAGHPLVIVWATGKELRLMTELDASLGSLVSSIKMSYSGLSFTWNDKRVLMDRVIDVHLVRRDGSKEEIEDDKLYKVVANMYAANMLDMLNGLTKGAMAITPKDEQGQPVTNFYEYTMKSSSGKEIKEWTAFKDYLESFPEGKSGYPEIPQVYADAQGRKNRISEADFKAVASPGKGTTIMTNALNQITLVIALLVLMIILLVIRRKKHRERAAELAGKEPYFQDENEDDFSEN